LDSVIGFALVAIFVVRLKGMAPRRRALLIWTVTAVVFSLTCQIAPAIWGSDQAPQRLL